jgi:hypothetical protein
MQSINLDSENSFFDAVNKTYGSLDYLSQFINDNGGNINILPIVCVYNENLNTIQANYAIKLTNNYTLKNIDYKKTWLQSDFDVVINVCTDLNKLANILSENNTKLGTNLINYSIQRNYISDIKVSNYFTNNSIRFNTGYTLSTNTQNLSFLQKEDLFYLLQENLDKIII